jgi:succinoglycan biosynthesis transport protein ExoP
MNEIEKVQPTDFNQQLVRFEADYTTPPPGISDTIIKPLLRHWRAAVMAFVAVIAIGAPAIWLMVRPLYESVGAIRVSPVAQNILFSDADSERGIPDYQSFMNTQAALMASYQVLNHAAADLKGRNLAIVGDDPFGFLRDSIAAGSLVIEAAERTELIKITMKSITPRQAETVVNSLIQAYMAFEGSNIAKGGDEKLTVLEDESRSFAEKLQQQRKIVRQMSEEFGTSALTGRQEMMLQQVTTLQTEITRVQTKKVDLESQIQVLEKTNEDIIPLEKVMAMRNDFLKSDPQLQTLSNNIAHLEQGLIVAVQTMTPQNPDLQRRRDLLDSMRKRLTQREAEIASNFEDMLKNEGARNRNYKLKEVKAELERVAAYEQRLLELLAKHNTETIELGRKQLAIQDQKEQLAITEEMYNTVRRRIQELEMEKKRPARISVAYNAASAPAKGIRRKLFAANVCGAGVFALLLALMLDRFDRRLHNPEDVTRRIGVRLLGTTIDSTKVERALLRDRIADDYQTIRANLGLFNDEKIPHKLVITSANPQEGKTTFAINLATSMAKAGTKVLLIDGDMRKPDIAKLLNISKNSNAVRRALLDYRNLGQLVCSIPSTGLDVLPCDGDDSCEPFEILSRRQTVYNFNEICSAYEHVIVDTPPLLAVPDALIWAKMADAVVLASFAEQTPEPDLQKATERLKQIDAKILGVVVNSVSIKASYNYGYGYGYRYGGQTDRHKTAKDKIAQRTILLPFDNKNKKGEKPF